MDKLVFKFRTPVEAECFVARAKGLAKKFLYVAISDIAQPSETLPDDDPWLDELMGCGINKEDLADVIPEPNTDEDTDKWPWAVRLPKPGKITLCEDGFYRARAPEEE